MSKTTITITRQFGSLGRPIAKRVSEILGYEYYDRDLVDIAAKELNLPSHYVDKQEEKGKSKWYNMRFPLGSATSKEQDEIYAEQEHIILELAQRGPAVFVGRCSDHILAYKDSVLRVGIIAPYEKRVENSVKVLHMDGKEAMETILDVDKARDAYHMKYTGHYPFAPGYQDVIINSALWGEEGTAQLIARLAKEL